MMREIVKAVIMETSTPSPKVSANPLIKVEPNQYKMTAEMIEEMFPSRIEFHARANPS